MARLLANQNDLLLVNTARYYGDSPVVVDNEYNRISLSPEFIDTVNGKLDASATTNWDVTPYTGGTGISVSNHQISCTGDITAYTAGSNISISNHVVSSKDWSSDISSTVNTALANYQTKLTGITDIQVVTALPQSPVANVLYLVKE